MLVSVGTFSCVIDSRVTGFVDFSVFDELVDLVLVDLLSVLALVVSVFFHRFFIATFGLGRSFCRGSFSFHLCCGMFGSGSCGQQSRFWTLC